MMKCRICGSLDLVEVVDLGFQPPSNNFIDVTNGDFNEEKYPLVARSCLSCALMQIEDHVAPEKLFHNEYAYLSSYSDTFVAHSRNLFDRVKSQYFGSRKIRFIEIASNDGYLLDHVAKQGHTTLGIEPTKLAASISKQKGHNVIELFLDEKTGKRIRQTWGQADLIIGTNVLAHTPNILSFLRGANSLLKKTGFIVFENPHLLSILKNSQFDTIYHEHFSYLSVTAVEKAFSKCGFKLIDVQFSEIHGGSVQYIGTHEASGFGVQPAVSHAVQREKSFGLTEKRVYQRFHAELLNVRTKARSWINEHKDVHNVVGYGAAAKASVFLNYLQLTNLDIRYIVDKNPAKHFKFMPGTNIEIKPVDALVLDKPKFIIVLVWNLKEEILLELRRKIDWECNLISFVPSLAIESI